MRLTIVSAIGAGVATTALFTTLPWVGTRSRSWRLAPHLGAPRATLRPPHRADRVGSEALLAIGTWFGRIAERVTGVVEPLGTRLDRVHHSDDPGSFRFRQGAAAVTAAVLGVAIGLMVAGPTPVITLLVVALPAAVLLVTESQLTRQCRRWSTSCRLQLPVVGEQLVALLRSGRSPAAALDQVADKRGTPLQRDVARVVDHLGRGGDLDVALRRWADVSDVAAVDRLTGVLVLHHRTPDLAALVSREVAASRDELHRDLLAQIDRRGQQVWIPVTVAALVPGAIFLLVPFFDALRLFGATT